MLLIVVRGPCNQGQPYQPQLQRVPFADSKVGVIRNIPSLTPNLLDAYDRHTCDAANGADVGWPIRANRSRSPCDCRGGEGRDQLWVMKDLAFRLPDMRTTNLP